MKSSKRCYRKVRFSLTRVCPKLSIKCHNFSNSSRPTAKYYLTRQANQFNWPLVSPDEPLTRRHIGQTQVLLLFIVHVMVTLRINIVDQFEQHICSRPARRAFQKNINNTPCCARLCNGPATTAAHRIVNNVQ